MFEQISLFGIPITSFSLLLMLAFLTAAYLIPKELHRRGLSVEIGDQCLLLAVLGTIVGAKIGFVFEMWGNIWAFPVGFWHTMQYVLLHWDGLADFQPDAEYVGLWATLFSRGGLVFYGGFAAGFGALYFYLKYKGQDIWRYGDAFIPSMAIGYGIGRLGCIVSGDGCFGYAAPVQIPFLTMVYAGPHSHYVNSVFSYVTGGSMGTDGVNVWNTPMMEAILSWILFAWMMLKLRHQNFRPGFMVAVFLVWNGIARFAVEFLRINDAMIPVLPHPKLNGSDILHHTARGWTSSADYFTHWHWYGFTQSQVFGVAIAIVGLIWILQRKLYLRDDTAKS
mgnify:CR=1 FL=1